MMLAAASIGTGYVLLLLLTGFVDPKVRGVRGKSIFPLIATSTLKMCAAISPFVAFVLVTGAPLAVTLGLTGFLKEFLFLWWGLVGAAGFFLLHIIWSFAERHLPGLSFGQARAKAAEKSIASLLPYHVAPLAGVFAVISLESGLLEELFFRGIVQSNLEGFMPTALAVSLAALLFGFAHFYQGIKGVVGAFLLGLWLGSAFAITGNLAVPVLGHILGNFACMMLAAKHIIAGKG